MGKSLVFKKIDGESNITLGTRFELHCVDLLKNEFLPWCASIKWTGCSGDEGRDIIIEMNGYKMVIQCKAYFNSYIKRGHVNEVEVTVRIGGFSFGILVTVEAYRIQPGAIRAANRSGGKVITTTYNRMCDDIKEKIINLLAVRINQLEKRLDERNKFNLNYYLLYKYWCRTIIIVSLFIAIYKLFIDLNNLICVLLK